MQESDHVTDLDSDVDPDELPESVDRAAVKRMQAVAWALDDAIPIPGTNRRVGIDPLIGVLPVAGDSVAALASMYIVAESARLGVPRKTLARMVVNIGIDASIGSIPAIGVLFDAGWKTNDRNVELAVEHLVESAPEAVPK